MCIQIRKSSLLALVLKAVLLCSAYVGAKASQNRVLVIKNARYFDNLTLEYKHASQIRISDGLIQSIDATTQCQGCMFIDAKGKYLLPGLIDAHQHTGLGGLKEESANEKITLLKTNLYWGITTVFNPNIELSLLKKIRQSISESPSVFPNFYSAGTNIGPPNGWGNISVANQQEANEAVALMNANQTNGIKFSQDNMAYLRKDPMPKHEHRVLTSMIGEAKRLGLPVYAHLSEHDVALDVVSQGVNTIIHSIVDQPVSKELVEKMKRQNVAYIATLLLYETIVDSKKSLQGQASFDPHNIHGEDIYRRMGSDEMQSNWYQWWDNAKTLHEKIPIIQHNLKTLADEGVMIGVGTDSATPGMILGPSLAYEMELYVQAGISPARVIDMATRGNARILGINDQVGDIQPGKVADLILLGDDPTEDISALRSIEKIIRGGVVHERKEFERKEFEREKISSSN